MNEIANVTSLVKSGSICILLQEGVQILPAFMYYVNLYLRIIF